MIPKIIHQTAPKNTRRWDPSWFTYQKSWKDKFPDAEYRMWTDEELDYLIKTKYNWFYNIYKEYDVNIKRIDAARYFLLFEYGGIYADMDFECVNNFYDQLDQEKICIAESGGINVARIENALIASPPKHEFWNFVLSRLVDNKNAHVFESTGPIFLQKCIDDYCLQTKQDCIQYLNASQYSLNIKDVENKFSIHHQTGVWTRPQKILDDTVIYHDNITNYIVSVSPNAWEDAFIINVFNNHIVVARKDYDGGWGQDLKLDIECKVLGVKKTLRIGASDSRIKTININLINYTRSKTISLNKKIDLKNTTLFCYDGQANTDINLYKKILNYINSWIDFGEIKLFYVNPFDFGGVEFHKIEESTIVDYSNFLVKTLNSYIETEFCMVFQLDGFPLNPDYWDPSFLNYDYIGAPWPNHFNLGTQVGNGGFSLRSKKFLEISSKLSDSNCNPEDAYLLSTKKYYLEKNNIKIAPLEIAKKFSIENPIDKNHSIYSSFGFHSKALLGNAIDTVKYNKIEINII